MMFFKDLFITACLLSGQTERAARRLGVRFFLPELFRLRYANMGRIDPDIFTRQLDQSRSFEELAWCGHWNAFAQAHESEAEKLLAAGNVEKAQDEFTKAATYYTVSAFPGHTPRRMDAYWKARDLSDRIAPMLDPLIQPLTLTLAGEEVRGNLRFPEGSGKHPFVIISNGLEGTVQEISLPLTKYRHSNIGVFLMEMPGTYAYRQPMSGSSEQIYNGVIEHFAAHPRVDPERMAMVGVSFGGYWSARMAAVSPRLRCAVVSGAPLQSALTGKKSLGTPEIFVAALKKVLGAHSLKDLADKLSDLAFEKNDLFRRIQIPVLIINGDNDTLLGTEDSVLLDVKAPNALLKLYENDDHCAMGHYREWLDFSFEWLTMQFA